jgi:beta-amylase
LAIKCAGVHWWYNSRSHAAELTAGYFNTRSGDRCPERDGYEPIVAICGKHGARLNFTCAEMRDVEHPFFSRCGPEGLLRQIRAAAARYGVKVAGENALCRFDQDAYDKIITNCRGEGDDAELWSTGALLPPMASFTFLRLSKELFEDDNFRSFVRFVARMANETGTEVVEAGKVVQAEEVLSSLFSAEADLLPGGLRDIRDETSSGFVAAQFSDL